MPPEEAPAAGGRGSASGVRTLAKGLEILSLFRPDQHTLTVEEIAKSLDFPMSSTYRLVATLKERGYLRKAPAGDGYTLDTSLLRFGEVVRASFRLHEVAQSYMEELVASSNESAVLALRRGDRGIVVAKVDSPESVKFVSEVDWSFPLHAGATGKVLLAYSSRFSIKRYLARSLERVTENTITDPEALNVELKRIRDQGYAIADEELMLGVRALAAPVIDEQGEAVASLSVAGPAFRFTRERAIELAPLLRDCCDRMSVELHESTHDQPAATPPQGGGASGRRRPPRAS